MSQPTPAQEAAKILDEIKSNPDPSGPAGPSDRRGGPVGPPGPNAQAEAIQMNPVYYVNRKTYRGRDGWRVGSRGLSGFPVSIWVPTYDQAVRIRAVLRTGANDWDAVDAIIREQP
jgi:hypothetical protein